MGSRGVSSETGVVVADSQTAACTDLFVCGICDFATSLIHPFLNHFKVHNFSISLDKDTHTCSSQDGASVDKQEDYKCYLCSCMFTTICRLHDHLMKCMTVSNGSYIFDNNKKTAFPFSMQSHHDLSEQALYNLASTACQDYSTDGDDITSHRAVQFPPNRNNNGLSLDAANAVIKLERESYKNELQENIPRISSDLSTIIDEILTAEKTAAVGMEHVETEHVETEHVETEHVETEKTTSRKIKDKNKANKEGAKQFSFEQCNNSYKNAQRFKEHKNIHLAVVPKFEICDKTFVSPRTLKVHVMRPKFPNIHGQDNQFSCEQCDKSFQSPQCLKRHRHLHRGVVTQCDICEKTFNSLTKMKVHRKVHLDAKPYVCHICHVCGKGYTAASSLRQHVAVQHYEGQNEMFKCEKCDAKFFTAHYLQRHMHKHTGIKTNQCDLCGKRFSRKDFLQGHIQAVHKQEKRFECNECGLKFRTNYELKCHTMTHTGVRPHWCKYCDAKFIQRKELRKHMKKNHGLDLDDKPMEAAIPRANLTDIDASMAIILEHSTTVDP